MSRLLVVLILIVTCLSLVAYAQDGHEYSPLVEKTVNYKNWTLNDIKDDKPVDLRAAVAGKKLVMVVYFAPWCGNWRHEAPVAARLYEKYKDQGFAVIGVYWGTLGKLPNTPKSLCPSLPDGYSGQCRPLYNEYIADVSRVTQGIVVNDQLDPNVINANKHAFVDQFVNTEAFKAKYDGLNNQQFVDTLFQTTGINASAADRAVLVNGLSGVNGQPATETRSSVVFKIVDGTTTLAGGALVFNTTYGETFYNQEFDDAFVFMEYLGYLRRNPDQAGFEFWRAKLKQYGNWQDAQMVLAFISSPEYKTRFGAP